MSNDEDTAQRWTFGRFLKTTAAIIAALTSLVGLVNFGRQMLDSGPALTLFLLSRERLTAIPEVPGLVSEFRFDNRPVKDLWKMRLRLQNTGRKTIVFDGPNRNIVRGDIELTIAPIFELLGRQIESNPQAIKMEAAGTNGYAFSSLQWRRDEQITFSVFLERKDLAQTPGPASFAFERVLVDGEITVADATVEQSGPARPILDRIAPGVASTVRLMLYVFLGLVGAAGAMLAIIAPYFVYRDARKKLQWRKNYLTESRIHLKKALGSDGYENFMRGHSLGEMVPGTTSRPAPDVSASLPKNYRVFFKRDTWKEFVGERPESADWVTDDKEPTPFWDALALFVSGLFITAVVVAIFAAVYVP